MSTDLITRGLRAWEAQDVASLSSVLNDDFVFDNGSGEPLDQHGFLGLMHILLTALPDFQFNEGPIEEQDGHYVIKTRITGTHTGPLNVPNLPSIPATGHPISLPEETQTYTITHGKISRLDLQVAPDGGMPALLAQIDAQLPG